MAAAGSRLADSFSPLVDRKNPEVENFSSSAGYLEACALTRCSKSKPVTVDNLPKLMLNRDKLKLHCRNSVHPTARKRLWLDVVGVQDMDSVLLVKTLGEPREDVEVTEADVGGLGPDLSCVASFHLRRDSYAPGLDRVLTALCRRLLQDQTRDTVHAPLLPVLAQIMLHFIEEWQVFALLVHLMTRKSWLDQSHTHCAASHLTLVSLVHSHASSTVVALCRLKPASMSQQAFLDKLTRNWYLWPFHRQPFWFTVRLVDMYVVEGPKIFYRLALAALRLFAAVSQKLDGVSLVTAVQDVLCHLSVQQRSSWLHDAFKISHLHWVEILRKWQSHVLDSGGSIHEARADTADGLGAESSDSSQDVEAVLDHTLSIPTSSELLPYAEEWRTLWQWLPDWVTGRTPECLFTASVDGYNLRTLYRRCEEQPFILLIKTNSGSVFGSFIASPLSDRHGKQFFGTGESFLFSVYPEAKCYQWTAKTDLILRATDHELIIGAGGGVFGLWLDSDLNQGSSGTCVAYDNPPLCAVDARNQFYCTNVEAYSCS